MLHKSTVALAETQSNNQTATTPVNGNLKVHFIDVGQADSILIQEPSGKSMLIDAGNNGNSDLVVNYLRSQGISKLDYVVGTHPHENHIGGLDVAINTFDIGNAKCEIVGPNGSAYGHPTQETLAININLRYKKAMAPIHATALIFSN